MTRGRSHLCAGAAALSFAAAVHLHPVFGWGVCAPIAFRLAARSGARAIAAFGALFGALAVAGAHAVWVSSAVASYFHLSALAAAFAATVAMLAWGALLGSILGLLAARAVALGGLPAALAVGCVWVLWESLCTAVLPHYPWASLAVTQARRPEVLQIAGWLGHSAVSFAVAATGAALGLAAAAPSPRDRRVLLVSAVAIVSTILVAGRLRLSHRATAVGPSSCSLRTIDAVIPSGELPRDDVLRRYEAATTRFLGARPDAVVWPESALPASPEVDARLREWLRQRARQWGVVLVAGGPGVAWDRRWEAKVFNSVYRIGGADPIERYDKRRLVPFAEYWPAIGVRRPQWLRAEETVPGRSATLFRVGACRLGVLVCFEGEDAESARELVRAGADGILVLSNDAPLPLVASRLEVAHLRLRAVETGVSIVRVTNHGVSAVIDGHGRLLESSSGSALLARVPKPTSPAPALLWAGLFRVLCHGGSLVAVGWSAVLQRRVGAGSGEQSLPKLST
jgi:apolipoprotein N-acyltransferase